MLGDEVCDPGLPVEGQYCSECRGVVAGGCGDAVLQEPFESCDDGNEKEEDGCDDGCRTETGFRCAGEPSACVASNVSGISSYRS